MNWIGKYIWLCLLPNIIRYCESDNSLPQQISIEDYLKTEHDMISAVRNHLNQEHRRLKLLKKELKRWKSWRKSYSGRENEYIAVPQNIFHLFKNTTIGLEHLEKMMLENSYNETMAKVDIGAPTDRHLESIIMSLIDVQYMYEMKPENIMRGELMDRRVNTTLPVESCIFIGETCSKYDEHACVVDWLNACLPFISNDEKDQLKKIYKLMYTSYLFLNNTELAYKYADHYLGLDPLDIPANDVRISLGDQLGKSHFLDPVIAESHKTCRGVYKQKMAARDMRCRYNHENSAFLKIAPLKEEQLYDYPKIVLYYDAVYESEMNILKSIAKDKLMTSTVYGSGGEKRVTGFVYRISQTAFINNALPALYSVNRRIRDMTNLSLGRRSEWWQIVNYAPGGFYRVHSDYLPAKGDYVAENGNRMATVLFYLNNVSLGGETVFPRLQLSVTPVKGAALIWHNVLPDGSENQLLYHSACPVIVGEKWIFTQWIRARDQRSLRHIYEKYVH